MFSSKTTNHDWLNLNKMIGAVTLATCISALGGSIAWVMVLSADARYYKTGELFLIAGIVLVMLLTAALMRSISHAAGIERDRERTNLELEHSRARLQAIVKFLPVGVVVVDAADGRIVMANDRHEHLLRHLLIPGTSLWEQCRQNVYHGNGKPFEYGDWPMARARAGEVVLDEEVWAERGDGTRACLSVNAAPIFDDTGAISAAVIAFTDITEHKEIAVERAIMARRLVNTQEAERARLARELHDQMGQDLTALSIALKVLQDVNDFHDFKGALPGLRRIVENMSLQIHHTASNLRPTLLSHLGLCRALEDMVVTWSERLGVSVDIHLEALSDPLDDETATTVYRVVQEALTNIAKHSQARSISVTAQHSNGKLRIAVEDDGRGFDCNISSGKRPGCFGLSGMRERMALVGGDLAVESAPGHGTTIFASLPAAAEPIRISLQ